MLFSRVYVSHHPAAEAPSDQVRVTLLDAGRERELHAAWNMADAIADRVPGAVRAALSRFLGEGCAAAWPVESAADCERLALDAALPLQVRGVLAALALGRPIGGDAAQGGKGPEGGTPAILKPERPRRPPGGASAKPVSPFASLQGATS